MQPRGCADKLKGLSKLCGFWRKSAVFRYDAQINCRKNARGASKYLGELGLRMQQRFKSIEKQKQRQFVQHITASNNTVTNSIQCIMAWVDTASGLVGSICLTYSGTLARNFLTVKILPHEYLAQVYRSML